MFVGDLFAGIGGFSLGLERAGMKTIWQVESDEFCRRVLAKHWPNVQRHVDIFDFIELCRGGEIEQPDVITGGFPCQPFSQAGVRKGQSDDRYLWPAMLEVLSLLRPAWVIGENVAGIVRMALDQVLSDLEDEGYSTQAFIIPACGLDAPHRRERVWIVAHSGGQRRQQDSPGAHGHEGKNEGRAEEAADLATGDGQGRREGNVANPSRVQPGREKQRPVRDGAGEQSESALRHSGCGSSEGPRGSELGEQIASWWQSEPRVGRMAHGIPHRVDRLRALGNAVVPQIPYILGLAIGEAESLKSRGQGKWT